MRSAFLLVIVSVLIYGTAVSSTSFEDDDVTHLSNLDLEGTLIEPRSYSKHQSFRCVQCRYLARYVHKRIIKNLTEPHLKTKLTEFCKLYKKDEPECVAIVNKYSSLAFRLIKNTNPESICYLIDVCHKKTIDNEAEVAAIEVYTKGRTKCSICKMAMRILKNIVKKGGKETIKKAMDKVCHKMGVLKHSCEKIVKKHADRIVDLVSKDTHPEKICQEIGLCKPKTNLDEEY